MMMALLNSTVNKKDFCANYNISITDDCWPAAHLPEIILGDRGELEGYNVNHLIEGLNITIENNPSFRPDWKGIVEKLFDTSQEKYGHFTWVCFKRLGKKGHKRPTFRSETRYRTIYKNYYQFYFALQ